MDRIAIKMAVGSFAILLTSSALAAGDFSRGCRNVDLHRGSVLDATCRTIHGSHAETGIELNTYIANIDGSLLWQKDGNFIASSRECELDHAYGSTFLRCDTQRANGTWTSSSLNLDERIANVDGGLQYQSPAGGNDEL